MPTLTGVEVVAEAANAGIPYGQLHMATAIAWAESGLRTDAIGYNYAYPGGPVTSRDRGLWQINDYYHPSVTDACAFDKSCNARAMASISSRGTNWNPWSTYGNGAYVRYLDAAKISVAAWQAANSGQLPTAPPDPVSAALRSIENGQPPWVAAFALINAAFNAVAQARTGGSNPNYDFGFWYHK